MAVVKNTMKDQVYIEIRNRIFNRDFLPGCTLNIAHLSQELGVSNSPIREALAMLENEGLVISTTNARYKVVSLTEEFIQELNSAILVILNGAVSICARENRLGQLETSLEEALNRQKTLTPNTKEEQIYQLAVEFDRTIVNSAGNQLLSQTFNRWANLLYMSTALMSTSSNNSIREHERILEALKSRNLDKVTTELEKHYDKHIE
ncbi:MAG: GntR family transcriptional regulator [Clostridiaceae bacterium]|nr:GntR family transcriptional regulator [Clostridiaceae bacterium]